ncbi:MAG: ABC transporter substrate-binding protein [candidate division Zixibacteria bacterium]|nr:ABC transporter substrate-binding protein [candidate division Zixibacteria bacterium]
MLSSTTFQLSPNIELQGTRMAEYAVDSLKADSVAIITSTSPDHLRMSRSFSERFRQLGGKVAGIEYYRSRDKDFGPYIRDLKSILWNMPPDSIYFTNEEGDTLDPDGIPVGIDCLFLPGSPQQLRLLLPQIHFYQLTGNYLGSDGWADETIYRLGDNVTKGAVFPSPFLVGSNSDEDVQFSAAFDSRFGRQPTRLSRVGYDAIRLVIQACDKGCSSREKLVSALEQTKDFAGASGMITFGKNRENIELPLYRIESGKAVVIGENQGIVDSPEGE